MLAFDFEGFMGRDLFCRRGAGDSNCENGTSNDSYVEEEEEEEEDIKHRAVSKYETMAARIEKGRLAKGSFLERKSSSVYFMYYTVMFFMGL